MKSRKTESGGLVWSNRLAVAVGDPAETAVGFECLDISLKEVLDGSVGATRSRSYQAAGRES